ncbi:MAG: manganese catalase family protein [Solirubrobacterales bacterium]|jgi:Mn-containing catalase|nr:manganese catalase family protein [Solirubrobacterales bacterium]
MIVRFDRIAVELPPPSTPDPAGASVVQELMGGKFGEMSTFMNYSFQSWNFRDRQKARPFYDLIANIAAEEFGHMEVVAMTINSMLTGVSTSSNEPDPSDHPLDGAQLFRNTRQWISGGMSALPQNSNGDPWTGEFVNATGDLVQDLVHNYFLESGARREKLRVYEAVDHPAAKALTGYLLVRGGVHQVAYARALENLTGANMSKLFPSPSIPTDKIPECQPYIKRGEHTKLYRFSPTDYHEMAAVWNGNHPETGDPLAVVDTPPEGFIPNDLPAATAVTTPDWNPDDIAEISQRLREAAGLPKQPTGEVKPVPDGLFKGIAAKVTPGG